MSNDASLWTWCIQYVLCAIPRLTCMLCFISRNDFITHPIICMPFQILKEVLIMHLKCFICLSHTHTHTLCHDGADGRPTTITWNKIEKDTAGRKVYINKLVTASGEPLYPSCVQPGSHNQMHQAHITSLYPEYLLCHPARKISLAGELIYGRQKVIPSCPVRCSRASSFATALSLHSLKALDTVFALRCNVW